MQKLVITKRYAEGRREIPAAGTIRIGRRADLDVVIEDTFVSRVHAKLEPTPGGWEVSDLQSRNGTYVSDRLVTSPTAIEVGERIVVGETVMWLEEMGSDGPTPDVSSVPAPPAERERQDTEEILEAVSVVGEEAGADGQAGFGRENTQDLRHEYQRLRFVFELSRELALEAEPERLLETAVIRLQEWLPADRAVILLAEDRPDGRVLVPRCARSSEAADNAGGVRLSESILRRVAETKSPVLSEDTLADRRFKDSDSVALLGVRSAVAVPMLHGDRLVGAIYVDSLRAPNVFEAKDLQILQAFAAQAAFAIENAHLLQRASWESATRQQFQRLLSPNIVEQVIAGDMELTKGGKLADITVLFCDIRDFTQMSEEHSPEAIVRLLNAYYELMVDTVFQFDGTLDKFLGDGLIAIWGAPVPQKDHAIRAVRAAVRMQAALRSFNRIRSARGFPRVSVGIGIDTGKNVVGCIGSRHTLSYSVIGGGANRAARLCEAALRGEVLVSDTTYEATREEFAWQGRPPLMLKGISNPVPCYRVLPGTPKRSSNGS